MSANKGIITVTQLNTYIKSHLEEDKILSNLFVKGEISNFTKHLASGHMYFTLKDEGAAISCVMFKGYASQLPFEPEAGLKVILRGKISLYSKSGNIQIYAIDMQPDGIGALTLAFEQLKEKLNKEGLFDIKHKKNIPKFPENIGVITSKTGAVIEDIKNVVSRRFPLCKILLFPVNVQGEKSPKEISNALNFMDEKKCDVIIVGRGGGSIEDLWAFNTEIVARSIFSMKTPVISAVGHEIDYTIADFVADLRAPTPSAAAELATPNQKELLVFLDNSRNNHKKSLDFKIKNAFDIVSSVQTNRRFRFINQKIDSYGNKVKFLNESSRNIMTNILNEHSKNYIKEITKLESLNPLAVLKRGYTIIENENGIIDSITKTRIGDIINIKIKDGIIKSEVTDIKETGETYV